MANQIHLGNTLLKQAQKAISGKPVQIEGEAWFVIENYDQMLPFFMSIVSPYNHWLFLSSTGALTAGRIDATHALFPYYTDDKIHDSGEITGSKSIFLVKKGGHSFLWEPFNRAHDGVYSSRRNIYKHRLGHRIIFEEINEDLGLSFRYGWNSSDRFGFIRQASLQNTGEEGLTIQLLDGVQNLLPASVNLQLQTLRSTLVDAYKKSELEADCGLGIYALSAIPVDKPEPSEALLSTTVWSEGLEAKGHLLCNRQWDEFRQGNTISSEINIRAERGAYMIHATLELEPQAQQAWSIVIEGDQDAAEVANLKAFLLADSNKKELLDAEIQKGSTRLAQLIGSADGLQASADTLSSARHISNVLFNVMRGGLFWKNEELLTSDFFAFLDTQNPKIAESWRARASNWPATISYPKLLQSATSAQETRVAHEYLPLFFSRRHGDPSRPWNQFSIHTQDEQGEPIFYYEGNWRDIFQNWEALAWSYPTFIHSMIAKFVNASTADGYNPYRITRNGIDWEVLEPDDPWAFIGYWGDHQIIYLQKLMEVSEQFFPGKIHELLGESIFSHANVPYRIKGFDDLLSNPHDTIEFAYQLEEKIEERVQELGADGKLMLAQSGEVQLVNLTEKLLITSLTKLSNLILEGGIWMNTQRPEWNDANNALVGYGISVVTLCYLKRFQLFCEELFKRGAYYYSVSEEVANWFVESLNAFENHQHLLEKEISDSERLAFLRVLGNSAEKYRNQVYQAGFSGESYQLNQAELVRFFSLTQAYIDHSIRANQREDKLFHAYNLWERPSQEELKLCYLYPMLEGQVAVLSAGVLNTKEVVELLNSLKESALFRDDQYSYMLYPNRDLPRFTSKNQIPHKLLTDSQLIQHLLDQKDKRLVVQDQVGEIHFRGTIRNGKDVADILAELQTEERYQALAAQDQQLILDTFEEMFDHKSFTGRSGTFFGYEGLGSIYWHMVSKLLLAVAETYFEGKRQGSSQELLNRLVEHYYEIRAGIGLNKSPELYGAFPTDPYSHTPWHQGAQQPGMTGQVKEDILSRFFELGVCIADGKIHFQPFLLRESEFLTETSTFKYFDIQGDQQQVELPTQSLAFTICQTLVIYHLGGGEKIRITDQAGKQRDLTGLHLPAETCKALFGRTGEVQRIDVYLKPVLR